MHLDPRIFHFLGSLSAGLVAGYSGTGVSRTNKIDFECFKSTEKSSVGRDLIDDIALGAIEISAW